MTETPKLSIYEEAFAKSDKTDAILVVDGKKLHVNKATLSYHSDYFNALFNSDFKEKSMEEIPVEDVESEDFATLLSLVHDKPLRINSNNAPNLLKLADRFQMHTPKVLVGNVLITSTEFTKFQKLFYADTYNLKDLFDHAMGLYDSRAEFLDFYWNSGILKEFSDAAKARLFEKLVKNHGNTF
ncbi:unnamed protein product [Caenorhabditis brenneri]